MGSAMTRIRIEIGPRFLQVGQDLPHHAVVGAVRVPYEQPDIPAVVNEPPDELLHRLDVGGVNLVGAAALVVGASVRPSRRQPLDQDRPADPRGPGRANARSI